MKKLLSIILVGTLMFLCTAPIVNAATFWLKPNQQTNHSGEVIGYEKYIGCRNTASSKYDVLAQAKFKKTIGWGEDIYFYVAPNDANYMVKTKVRETDTTWRMDITSCGTMGCEAKGEIIYD